MASAAAAASAWRWPTGVSGTSRLPVNRRSRDDSVSPCRRTKSLSTLTTGALYVNSGPERAPSDYARSAKTFWAARTEEPKSTGTPSSASTCSSPASPMMTSKSAA